MANHRWGERRIRIPILTVAADLLDAAPNAAKTYYTACCPIHGEKSASLVLWPAVNGWRCYVCCRGGGPLELVQFILGASPEEAAGYLAALLGDVDPQDWIGSMLGDVDLPALPPAPPPRLRKPWRDLLRDLQAEPWWTP